MRSPSVNKLCTQWRKNHRRVLSVPSTTHCDMLPLIADNISIESRLDCKYLGFYKSIATSDNKLVNYVARSRLNVYSSTMGKNMAHLLNKYSLQVDDVLTFSKKKMKEHCYQKWRADINEEYIIYSQIIRELILTKENRLQICF